MKERGAEPDSGLRVASFYFALVWVIKPVRSAKEFRLAFRDRDSIRCGAARTCRALGAWIAVSLTLWPAVPVPAQSGSLGAQAKTPLQREAAPPRVIQARRFLAERGWTPGKARKLILQRSTIRAVTNLRSLQMSATSAQSQSAATWQPLGPAAVLTPNFGLVTGRVAAAALDPSDPTGNRLYLGTTGGGVWVSQNAGVSDPSLVTFTPLTDAVAAMSNVPDASISIGALTVQPGGTGVILAGTGDPNDVLDSYYGTGILRSTDGGNSWTLIQTTSDVEQGLGFQDFSFIGEGFAGFAWSTVNPQLVVAAVSQAYEGTLVDAERSGDSYEGLYYSTDSGATWHLATISDGNGSDVQGPVDTFALPDGNAATSVVWNPVRQLFIAAVRYHGYYQSADGVTWTRMATQPGSGLSTTNCTTNIGSTGSIGCPIYRGTLAVNPLTGDTFAWTVDAYNQDQGLRQDQCAVSGGACTNPAITFAKSWNTTALEANTAGGAATILNGDYNLTLAAVPSGQDTLLLAGDNDLWKCSLALGCVWRNTTNATTCMSAQVGEYQHALAWNAANPMEIFVGNDSGLWRSTDAIGETGQACSSTDATHFQNLNGNLGSLAEAASISQTGSTPYTMMAGLGVNGTTGVKSTTGPTTDWPLILGGAGGPVAIDPGNRSNWYVNNAAGVSIHLCSQSSECTPDAFGASPVVSNADTGGDGYTMGVPAPFLVDPLDTTQLLIGTCRVWRGPADGSGWTGGNVISPIGMVSSGSTATSCQGNPLIRSMAAMALPGGSEVVYVGMYGSANGGANLPGHVLSAILNPASSTAPVWQDLTLNPVSNDSKAMNAYGLDISSIYIDPHDTTGSTVYVTVAGMASPLEAVRVVYRSTDGGAHWEQMVSNLPSAPANSIVIDPQDANTAYLATDVGVYSTTQIGTCAIASSACWAAFGAGLPATPVVAVSASPATVSSPVLVAATYGRGMWQAPLATTSTTLTTASASPSSVTFPTQAIGSTSSAQTVTLTNMGTVVLTPAAFSVTGDFTETDNCQGASVAPGASCAVQVVFAPTATGTRTGQMTVSANVAGGQLSVGLSGTGATAGVVTLSPTIVNFGDVQVGTNSSPMQVEVGNSGASSVSVTGIAVTGPFTISSNACGSSSLAGQTDCQVMVEFAPTQTGPASGTLTLTDAAGTQTTQLSGSGEAPPADTLSPVSLAFPATVVGQLSSAQAVTLSNTGGVPLTSISVTVSGGFQASNNCGTQLAAQSSCAISVVFAPGQIGSQTGMLTVSDALHTQTVSLSGTGLKPPALSISASSLSFTSQLGVTSSPQTLTVSNTGGAPMSNVGFQITGAVAGSFSTGTTTCGATLNNGSSCTVQVIFTPAAVGGSSATLTVSSSTLGVSAVSVLLNGTATAASGLSISPLRLTFPVVSPGQSSAPQTVTIANPSSVTATSLGLTTTPQFSLTQNTCGSTLAAGASCSTGVVFQPTASGAVAGTLTVSSATFAEPVTVALSGAGGIPVTPTSISFPSTGVGTVSSPTAVTIANPASAAALSNLVITASTGFELAANTCGATLDPGASCTVGVEFAPTAAGQQSGSLTVASSNTQSLPVALSGMGFDFTAAVSGNNTQSVSAGQTADYTLALAPLNGSQGTFTFQCGTLPANAVCLFNPASETVAAGTHGNVTLQISTGQSSASARSDGPAPWGALPLLCGFLVLPMAWKRRRWPTATGNAVLLVALLAIVVGGLSSCSSAGGGASASSTGQGKSGVTPPGTYSISVTATSTGVQHSATLTLNVD